MHVTRVNQISLSVRSVRRSVVVRPSIREHHRQLDLEEGSGAICVLISLITERCVFCDNSFEERAIRNKGIALCSIPVGESTEEVNAGPFTVVGALQIAR